MNEVVVGSNARVLDMSEEKQLEGQVSLIQGEAGNIVIANDNDCNAAAKMLDDIKGMEKKVTAYWEPMRQSTYAAYQSVMKHKKEMLDPLQKAAKVIQKKVDGYVAEKNRILREQEEHMRRLANQEVDRKIAEAAEAESRGDELGASYAMAEAEMADSITNMVGKRQVSIEGVAIGKKSWEIDSLIPEQVPITVCGVTVYIKDKAAVERIVKQVVEESDGNVQIPGVEFHEKHIIKIRK